MTWGYMELFLLLSVSAMGEFAEICFLAVVMATSEMYCGTD